MQRILAQETRTVAEMMRGEIYNKMQAIMFGIYWNALDRKDKARWLAIRFSREPIRSGDFPHMSDDQVHRRVLSHHGEAYRLYKRRAAPITTARNQLCMYYFNVRGLVFAIFVH